MDNRKPVGFVLFDHEVRCVLSIGSVCLVRPYSISQTELDGYRCDRKIWDQLRFDRAWLDGFPHPSSSPQPYLQVPRYCPEEDCDYTHRLRPRITQHRRIWVKESWASQSKEYPKDLVYYRSDRNVLSNQSIGWFRSGVKVGRPKLHPDGPGSYVSKWNSATSMNHWASRLQLEVLSASIFRIKPFENPNFQYRKSDIFPSSRGPDMILDRGNSRELDNIFWDRKFPKCKTTSGNWVYALECQRIYDPSDDDRW